MRLPTEILYPLRRNRIAVLGARRAPRRCCQTRQRLCRDIKGRALGWLEKLSSYEGQASGTLDLQYHRFAPHDPREGVLELLDGAR